MRPGHEQLIAPRTLARLCRKIFPKILIALALALLGHRSCQDGFGRNGCWPCPLALAVTPALFAPLRLSLRCCAITPCGLPTVPLAGRLLTRLAAIALEGMARLEGLFASLQQADARITTAGLTGRVGREILKGAHGRSRSHRSSLGDERLTRLRGVLVGTAASG
jgi:hypothetical protein